MSQQLLVNASFDDGTTGWTASGGFGTYSYTTSNQIAVLDGVAYFTYVSRTLSQTVNVSSVIPSSSSIVAVVNLRHRQKGDDGTYSQVDAYNFEVVFKNSSGSIVTTKRTPSTGNSNAPQEFTDINLTLERSEIPSDFDSIATAEVKVTGLDSGFWNGNHGPMVDYVTLTAYEASSSSSAACHADTGVVLYYNPSDANSYSEGSAVVDLSDNGLVGTLSNVEFSAPYFEFNGSNSQISTSDDPLLEPGAGDWTMEAWVYPTEFYPGGAGVVLGKFDNGGGSQDVSYSIRINSAGSLYCQMGDGLGNYVNSTMFQLTLNTWHHVVYVWSNVDSNTLETYINGSLIGSASHSLSGILNTANSLYFGSYNNGEYAQYFKGRMGLVRLYNRRLSAEEAGQNHLCGQSVYADNPQVSSSSSSSSSSGGSGLLGSVNRWRGKGKSGHFALTRGIIKRLWPDFFRHSRSRF
jgi:hypothetical protein